MANTLLTNDIISKTALMEFKNNLVMAKTCRRQYQEDFNVTTGSTIRIRKPTRYTVREGRSLQVQNIQERQETLTIAYQDGVDVAVTSQELSLQLDDFNRDILTPAMLQLANKVDQRLYNTTLDIYNAVGTPGSSPNSFATVNNAGALLTSYGTELKNRFAMFSPTDGAAVQNSLYNTFNEQFNKSIILDGMMGNLAGFDCYQVQNTIRPVVVSTQSIGTPLVNGVSQSGAVLNVDGLTNGMTIYKGAVFTIADVYAVNQITRNPLINLQQFVVTADTVVNGSGQAALPIGPAIVLTGPYQNVSAGPVDGAALTFVTAQSTRNIAYNSEAFTLAVIKLPADNNNGAWQRAMVDKDANVSIRMTRQYDIQNDQDIIRFDILYGVKCFPEYAGIIWGA